MLETTVHAFAVSDRARVRDETERRTEIEGRGLQRIEEFSRDVRDRKSPF